MRSRPRPWSTSTRLRVLFSRIGLFRKFDDFGRDFDVAFRQFGHTDYAAQTRGVALEIVLSRSSMQVTRFSVGKGAFFFVGFVIVVWVALSKCASIACSIYSFSMYTVVS